MNDLTLPDIKRPRHSDSASRVHDVLIVGAGFAGLGSAIRLQQSGVRDILILERGSEVGGTWRDNQYPGAACDIPSNLYSYSFAQNPQWSRGFSGAAEIMGYVHHLVARFDLHRLIEFNRNVTSMSFDEDSGLWTVSTEQGEPLRARNVVMGQGPLSNASFPNISGIEDYKGKKIHSARWDHDYDFRGKRVAVVGTGASAIQIVPELVKQAATVKVFQRTPAWVMPRPDYASPEWSKSLFSKFPLSQTAFRELLYWVHESMAVGVVWTTPVTRLQKDNCELITWPIANLAADGIRTVEGIEHQVDCIVFATGFEVSKSGAPFPVTGLNDRSLDVEWSRGAKAYKSVSVSGYPNLYMTFGPNSGPGHNSALVYMEAQIDYIVKGVKAVLKPGVKYLDVRDDVQHRHNQRIQKRLQKTNWNSGCSSWYLTEDGFNATMFPGLATQFRNQMAHFRLKDYSVSPG